MVKLIWLCCKHLGLFYCFVCIQGAEPRWWSDYYQESSGRQAHHDPDQGWRHCYPHILQLGEKRLMLTPWWPHDDLTLLPATPRASSISRVVLFWYSVIILYIISYYAAKYSTSQLANVAPLAKKMRLCHCETLVNRLGITCKEN